MRKIRFNIDYGRHKAGHVIGTKDSEADMLVNAGIASYENTEVRPLKYAATANVQSECIAPTIEEVEASPKGAILPPMYDIPEMEAEERETKDVKAKKKKVKPLTDDKQKTNT